MKVKAKQEFSTALLRNCLETFVFPAALQAAKVILPSNPGRCPRAVAVLAFQAKGKAYIAKVFRLKAG